MKEQYIIENAKKLLLQISYLEDVVFEVKEALEQICETYEYYGIDERDVMKMNDLICEIRDEGLSLVNILS